MEKPIDPTIQRFRSRVAAFFDRPLIGQLGRILGSRECHLVGGALRDLALGQHPRDLDLVVAGDGDTVAAELAELWGCRSIRLGPERFAAYRVARADLPVDIWDRRHASLDDDLARRDFTIHSFAVDLHNHHLYDPFAGLRDLANGLLRMTTTRSFVEDPLRILRLFRFVAQLEGFGITPDTLESARDSLDDLSVVATERIRAEIEWTLETSGAHRAFDLWIDLGLIPDRLLGLPMSGPDRQEVRGLAADGFSALEKVTHALPAAEDLSVARLGLLLLELSRVNGVDPGSMAATLQDRGYLTKRRAQTITHLLDLEPLPVSVAKQRWFLHRAGDMWPSAVGLAAARTHASHDELQRIAVLTNLVELASDRPGEIFHPPPLVDGRVLQERLSLTPGAKLGRILAAIRRRQIEGTITTAAEALAFASRRRDLGGQD
jgi:tRNA nucleotidyltransferase/poly(A) polymerase